MKARHLLFCAILSGSIFLSGKCHAHELPAEAPLNTSLATPAEPVRHTGLLQKKSTPLTARYFSYPNQGSRQTINVKTSSTALPDTLPEAMPAVRYENDQSGRTELITSSLAYSLLYYGWAVPTALNADGGRAYVASYMLLGGGGFFVPFLATRDGHISEGMARGFTNGAFLGIAHGWALTLAISGSDINGRTGLGISVLGSLAEGLTTMNYARRKNLSLGHMSMMGYGGIWGGLLAVPMPYYFNSNEVRPYAISGLLGSGLGIWAGDRLARTIPIGDGDAQIMATTGALGTYFSVAMLQSVSDNFNRGSMATLMIGSAAGLGLGFLKIKRLDYSASDANLITLGTFAGGLIGLGVVYVAAENATEEVYLWGSGLGALGGFVLTDRLIRGRRTPNLGGLKIQVNPMAVRSLINPTEADLNRMPNQFMQPHLINASLRF